MGMIRIDVIRPTDKGRARLSAGRAIDEDHGDEYTSRSVLCWNTRNIFFVRPADAPLDLPGSKSVLVTALGEFACVEPQFDLAARIHEAQERGIDLDICKKCGNVTTQDLGRSGACASCVKEKAAS